MQFFMWVGPGHTLDTKKPELSIVPFSMGIWVKLQYGELGILSSLLVSNIFQIFKNFFPKKGNSVSLSKHNGGTI